MRAAVPQIVAFLLTLFLAHFALRYESLRRSSRFWLIVEYLWLFTGGFAVITVANEIRRTDIAAEPGALEGTVQRAYWEAQTMALGGEMVELSGLAENLRSGNRKGSWYRYLLDALDLGYESERWSHFLAQNADLEFGPPNGGGRIPQFEPKEWLRLDPSRDSADDIEHARLTLQTLRRLEDARHTWREAKKRQAALASEHSYGSLRRGLSWLLPFALALRVTKVRADFLRSENRSGTGSTPHQLTPGDLVTDDDDTG